NRGEHRGGRRKTARDSRSMFRSKPGFKNMRARRQNQRVIDATEESSSTSSAISNHPIDDRLCTASTNRLDESSHS
ncbi:MAG: hypothetical protein ACK53L_08945, partial [Pirellulaceae bacterium]